MGRTTQCGSATCDSGTKRLASRTPAGPTFGVSTVGTCGVVFASMVWARAGLLRHTIRALPADPMAPAGHPEVCCGIGAPVRSPGRRRKGLGDPAGHGAGGTVLPRRDP